MSRRNVRQRLSVLERRLMRMALMHLESAEDIARKVRILAPEDDISSYVAEWRVHVEVGASLIAHIRKAGSAFLDPRNGPYKAGGIYPLTFKGHEVLP